MSEDDKNSEWNYGSSYLFRLSVIENKCIECAINNDYNNWLMWLKTFYRELRRRMYEPEIKQAKKLMTIAELAVIKQDTGARDTYFNNVMLSGENELEEFECYLKDIITKRKMDLPSAADPGKALQ